MALKLIKCLCKERKVLKKKIIIENIIKSKLNDNNKILKEKTLFINNLVLV